MKPITRSVDVECVTSESDISTASMYDKYTVNTLLFIQKTYCVMLTPSSGGKYGCMIEHDEEDKNKYKYKLATLKRLIKSVYNMKIES